MPKHHRFALFALAAALSVGCACSKTLEHAPPKKVANTPPDIAEKKDPAMTDDNPLALVAGSVLSGTIELSSRPPPPLELKVEDKACAAIMTPQDKLRSVKVNEGRVQGVVVYVDGAKVKAKPSGGAVTEITRCRFSPDTLAIEAGTPWVFKNSGDVPIAVKFDALGTKFAAELAAKTGHGSQTIADAGKARLTDPAHSWNIQDVIAFDHPFFAVTDEKGRFEIKGLPDGSWSIAAYHPQIGTAYRLVQIKNGRGSVDMNMGAKGDD